MTWAYLPVLNECIKLLLTIAVGVAFGVTGVFHPDKFISQAIKFVFCVALPFHILGGIGIGVNFYSNSFLWVYIVGFLLLRAIALLISIVWVAIQSKIERRKRKANNQHDLHELHLDNSLPDIERQVDGENKDDDTITCVGRIAVIWLALTWISTVILGIPIMTATFGDPTKGKFYGLLAGISSFIFQLPLQMFFLECHSWLVEEKDARDFHESIRESKGMEDNQHQGTNEEQIPDNTRREEALLKGKQGSCAAEHKEESEQAPQDDDGWVVVLPNANREYPPKRMQKYPFSIHRDSESVATPDWREVASQKRVWKEIGFKMIKNPVVWGIFGGFILSLTTVGPRFLNPSSSHYVPGLGWIHATLAWFGACVSPVTLFTMGIWMNQRYRTDPSALSLRTHLLTVTIFMISKVILIPLLMLGISLASHLNDEAGRAAVLIASLPISMASFSLSGRYRTGQAILAKNVVFGTALMLPTVLVWNIVLDHFNLFPIAAS